ncbi:uncharacterized protein HMPREF1541_08420 [Cyphellophora europaea CBS 101466]|uniref:Aquaporin n=1 Tax=Cyphellophora europaea (strain CBS 101466) TaxID=1220924 RepID=W2RNY2_CYPE1|nr:uncharacterized protein HMPREF1541_08420 [Cyphellophora europaea CBS 101466]ETN37429.1 hypothetical protein HMPREF1541_08420 [Cyphellophora europaea CBS 101466]
MPPQDPMATNQGPDDDPDPDPDPDTTHRQPHEADPQRLQRTRTFSLAGPPTYEATQHCYRTDSYVQPEYRTYQERYEQERAPIWGLAAPLPRTVRPGMRPRRASDAQTLPGEVPTVNNVQDYMRHVQSNVSHQPSTARPLRRPSTRRPTYRRPSTTEPIREDSPPTYRPSEDHSEVQPTETAAAHTSQDASHLSRVDLLRTAAANAWQQHDDASAEHGETFNERTPGQVEQEISHHASHDFATDAPSRPALAPIQEVPRPSLVDKPEVEALRKQLQAQADFVPHRGRSIARAPTECDWEAPPHHPTPAQRFFSHLHRTHSRRSQSSSSARHDPFHHQEYLNTWSKYRYFLREPLSEFLACFVMMFLGFAANLMNKINQVSDPSVIRYGDFVSTNLTWGWACMAAIYIAGGVSGAHLSPVVTITLWLFRGFPRRLIWRYVVAQLLGCFLAALAVYALYRDAITTTATQAGVDAYEAIFATSSVFHTSPSAGVGSATIFCTQALMVALFTITVLALGDDRNAPPGAGMNAFIVGLFVFVIAAAFPYNTGASFNPFRDFGPRLVVSMVWARGDIWTVRACYWIWACWVAPMVGSLLGAAVYDICIFTGGESPVNYPGMGTAVFERTAEGWKQRVNALRGKGREADEEQGDLELKRKEGH